MNAFLRNCIILLLVMQTSVLTQKSNARLGGLGWIPLCTEQNSSQMPRVCLGDMGGFGIDWYIKHPFKIKISSLPTLWYRNPPFQEGKFLRPPLCQASLKISSPPTLWYRKPPFQEGKFLRPPFCQASLPPLYSFMIDCINLSPL